MAEGDRFEKRREVFGARRIDYKVSILDTNGGLFISEIMNDLKGGPARHTHHEQDEWFYVVEGEYIIEIGDQRDTDYGRAIPSSRREMCRMSGIMLERGQAS
jgi:mannose-6-phosphate isomerase-like protein (cupin superfamily)